MTTWITELADRGVVAVTGPEAVGFLQGLVTSDVERLATGEARYGALLTPQGKILFDFLMLRDADGFLIDVARGMAAELAKRLRFYKLRAQVDVADLSEAAAVFALWGEAPPALGGRCFADPRLAEMGWRLIADAGERGALAALPGLTAAAQGDFHAHRIRLGVPEGGLDFAHGDAFPHDADMDDLGGVDFAKGCYVGQEVVSRMKHRGTARRRVIKVAAAGGVPLPAAGTEIAAGGKLVGTLGSSVGTEGLALLRLDRAKAALDEGLPLLAGGIELAPSLPGFARFGWPATIAAD